MDAEISSSRVFFALLGQTFDGVAVFELESWQCVYANEAFERLMAGPPGAAAGGGPLDCLEPASRAELLAVMGRLLRDPTAQETQLLRAAILGGSRLDVRLCRVEYDGKGAIGMIVRESGPLPIPGSEAAHRHDPLTGLADREFLFDRISSLLQHRNAAGRSFAVLFLDLDHFKQVNDEFGHLRGDDVLREAAMRIADCVRDGDSVARFGGDEFVVILDGVFTADEVKPIVARIQSALAKPIAFEEGEATLSATVGVAIADKEHTTAHELLSAADRAMYVAKRQM